MDLLLWLIHPQSMMNSVFLNVMIPLKRINDRYFQLSTSQGDPMPSFQHQFYCTFRVNKALLDHDKTCDIPIVPLLELRSWIHDNSYRLPLFQLLTIWSFLRVWIKVNYSFNLCFKIISVRPQVDMNDINLLQQHMTQPTPIKYPSFIYDIIHCSYNLCNNK